MTTQDSRLTPVPPELAKIDPKQVNHWLLLEVVDQLSPLPGMVGGTQPICVQN